jgi:CelD/BcsL family acetyltransferase involved in cellulose biosynthesis
VVAWQRNARAAHVTQPSPNAAAAGIVNCIRSRLRQSLVTTAVRSTHYDRGAPGLQTVGASPSSLKSHEEPKMHVEHITTWENLAPLEHEWNALSGGTPFRSWDWLATWWKHYGSDVRRDGDGENGRSSERQLYVLAVFADSEPTTNRNDRKLIGIAPWYLDRTRIQGNLLRWLGSGEVCTDHLSLICRPEDTEAVAGAIAETLTTRFDDWDRIDLSAVDADDATIEKLLACLEERDCLVSRQPADACWALELPATWDEYLAGVSKSHRKQLRQLERRVLESNRVQWHRVKSAAEFDQAWPVLVDLHQRRRRSLGEPGCFASRVFHEFHREVAKRLLDRGQLRVSWMELDGSPAAAEYHVADAKATYAYQGGVDPNRLAEEPGRLSTILCLRAAIEEGHAQIDFLRGDEPYKAHWRAIPHATYDYRVIPNRRLARLRGRVWTVTDAIGDWVRIGAEKVLG